MAKINDKIEKSFKIRRYTLLRYLNALLFFMCLHWSIGLFVYEKYLQLLIPILIMVSILVTVKDQYASFTDKKVDITRSKKIYFIILISILLVGLVSISDYKIFFPYLGQRKYFYIIIVLMLVIDVVLYIKAKKISENTDSTYKKYIEVLDTDYSKIKNLKRKWRKLCLNF